MTDARLPAYWLNDLRFDDIGAEAFRLYAAALMWSVSNRTDGLIEDRRLRRLPWTDPACAAELAEVGLWERRGEGWFIVDFAKTQTSKLQLDAIDAKKVSERERVKKYRDSKRGQAEESSGTTYGTEYFQGEDRQEQGKARRGSTEGPPTQRRSDDEGWSDVEVASPGEGSEVAPAPTYDHLWEIAGQHSART